MSNLYWFQACEFHTKIKTTLRLFTLFFQPTNPRYLSIFLLHFAIYVFYATQPYLKPSSYTLLTSHINMTLLLQIPIKFPFNNLCCFIAWESHSKTKQIFIHFFFVLELHKSGYLSKFSVYFYQIISFYSPVAHPTPSPNAFYQGIRKG